MIDCPEDFIPFDFKGSDICVMTDYYKVDNVRQPLSYPEAVRIAQENGWGLPTKELVDEIWNQADMKLEPVPLPPGPQMTSQGYFVKHDDIINKQLEGRSYTLVAGHKKDIVQQQKKGRVTIYGWHRKTGNPIQPVYSGHGENYADYSHGVRFVIWDDNE